MIAKATSIGNHKQFLSLLGRLLEVEALLKRVAFPKNAFRDELLS